jgi:hypothetical protein
MPTVQARLILLLFCAGLACDSFEVAAQAPSSAPTATKSVYLAPIRDESHAIFSSPDQFQQVVDAVVDLLGSKTVVLANSPSQSRVPKIQSEMRHKILLKSAKDAGASYLLMMTVSRPVLSWLEVRMECLDDSGKTLWKERASYGGGKSSKGAVDYVLEKLNLQIQSRVGQTCLPVAPRPEELPTP